MSSVYDSFENEINRRCRIIAGDCYFTSDEKAKKTELIRKIYFNIYNNEWEFAIEKNSQENRIALINTIWNAHVIEVFKRKNII